MRLLIRRVLASAGQGVDRWGLRSKNVCVHCASILLWAIAFSLICPSVVLSGNQTDWQELLSLEELLNTPISTAARYEQFSSEAPASVTLITAEEIDRHGYRTLSEVLQQVRGFYTSNDRNYEYLGVRGFSRPTDYNNRILLMLNGHILNENVFGSAAIGTDLGLDLEAVERIEIVRGPGSALYGTGAMFSVINLIAKEGSDIDGLRVSSKWGSFGRKEASVALGKELAGILDLSLSALWGDVEGPDLFYAEYDDPATNHGLAQGLDWDRYWGLLSTARYKDFFLQGFAVSREKGIPTGAFEIAFNDPRARTLDASSHLELRFARDLSAKQNFQARLYLNSYRTDETYPYAEGVLADEPREQREQVHDYWVGIEGQFRWDLSPGNRLIAGSEYRKDWRVQYHLWDEVEDYFEGNFPFHVFSAYLQDEYQLREDLALVFGLRRDAYSSRGNSTIPRGAAIYHPTPSSTLKLLYGEAFRAPNVYERYYEEPEVSKGNPKLQAEKIRTTELVWEQRLGQKIFGTASVYHYAMDDLIEQRLDPTDGLFQFQNMGKTQARGMELELNARQDEGLSLAANYAFQQAEDKEGHPLTNSPAHLARLSLSRPLGPFLHLATHWRWESARRTLQQDREGRTIKTGSYLLGDLRLATAVRPSSQGLWSFLFRQLRLSFAVRNLLDTAYETPGGLEHRQPAIPQDGRSFALELSYAL